MVKYPRINSGGKNQIYDRIYETRGVSFSTFL